MNIENKLAWRLLNLSVAWTAAMLNKGTQQGGVVDGALASCQYSMIHPIAIDVAFLAILMVRWKGWIQAFLFSSGARMKAMNSLSV